MQWPVSWDTYFFWRVRGVELHKSNGDATSMKMSADYAHWENGRLSGPPGPLPNVWREHTWLHQFTDDQLAAIGWFPVERSCPKCAKNLAYRLDEDRQVIVAYVPQEEIERTKTALRSINERMMEQPQHFGFLSDALGMPHLAI